MRKWNKMLTTLLAGALLMGCLTGCGKSAGTEKEEASSAVSQASSQVQSAESSKEEESKIPTEPITLSFLVDRHSSAETDAENLWFFKYLEYWLEEQGYDITFDIQQTSEPESQVSLLLGTDKVPDLVWGIQLDATKVMTYGESEGMLFDWAPYINEESMPNLYALLGEEGIAACATPSGAIYGLPHIAPRTYGSPSGSFTSSNFAYINKNWLEKCGLEIPKTYDEYLDTLRAFKTQIKLENGKELVPALDHSQHMLARNIWTGLGYYGADPDAYGLNIAIKDGAVYLPAATEDFRTVMEYMHTMYSEGLIYEDYFTQENATVFAMIDEGQCGVFANFKIQNIANHKDWLALPMYSINGNEAVISANSVYSYDRVWASAQTEYPELIVKIMDYLYSPEGSTYFKCGPMAGEDPLGIEAGWYYDENGVMTYKELADNPDMSSANYKLNHLYTNEWVGTTVYSSSYTMELAGVAPLDEEPYVYTDAVTGEERVCDVTKIYTDETGDGWWRISTSEALAPNLTQIRLPVAYLAEEDAIRAGEIKTALDAYVKAEVAKFVTGIRPLDELDKYYEELKALDVEEYVEIYEKAYEGFLKTIAQ